MNEKFYRIKEVSEMTGVHPQTLRNWEREGLIDPIRISGNHRLYTQKEIDKIGEIIKLKDEGLRLKGIQKFMAGTNFISKPEKKKSKKEALAVATTPIASIKKERTRKRKGTQYTEEQLQDMRLEDLVEIAKRRGIKYFRQMFKEELVTAIAYPEREAEMSRQAKERTKERYGDKVYGKQKERLLAAQKQKEMNEVLTEKEAESIGLVKEETAEQPVGNMTQNNATENNQDKGVQQEVLIEEILKLGKEGKSAQEIAQHLIQNYKL